MTTETEKSQPFSKIEDVAVTILLVLLAILPAANALVRLLFGGGLASSAQYVRYLTLWVAMIGGVITTRQNSHLALTSGFHQLVGLSGQWTRVVSDTLSLLITVALTTTALSHVLTAFDPTQKIGFIPIQFATAILPLGFGAMAGYFIVAGLRRGRIGLFVLLGIPGGLAIASGPLVNVLTIAIPTYWPDFTIVHAISSMASTLRLPLIIILLASALIGTPIFVILIGFTLLQFLSTGGALEVVPDEAYAMLSQPLIPALPLFTLAGFLLSESKAGERLITAFQAWFSWFNGSLGVMAVVICAFFTTFTGASGVTVLALGGLLLFMLKQDGYNEKFATGLLTASGSIGLLFPPALPIIMYGVIAQIDIRQLFIGGFLPGLAMVATLSALAIFQGTRKAKESTSLRVLAKRQFHLSSALQATRRASWELSLPVLVLLLYFGGFATLVETAAIATIYVLLVEIIIHRDISLQILPRVLAKCTPIIGGVLVILAAAKGLAYFMVDAEVPTQIVAWLGSGINSKILFLILLNLTLLIAGALMDIFSAIVILCPLVIPLGASFGVHPVHLGIIFLANLELGYLTPPVGMNLFLASYRFELDLVQIYRRVVPFFFALLLIVLLITYVPSITTALLPLFGF